MDKPGVAVCADNPSTTEGQAGRWLWVQGQPVLPCLKKKKGKTEAQKSSQKVHRIFNRAVITFIISLVCFLLDFLLTFL